MLTVIPEISSNRIFVTANRSWPHTLLMLQNRVRTDSVSNDSVVPGCYIYKDILVIPSNHALQGLQS